MSLASSPTPILQQHLALTPWTDPQLSRLPGLVPVALNHWLMRDDAFPAQMALKDALLRQSLPDVFLAENAAHAPAEELLACLVAELPRPDAYAQHGDAIIRQDETHIPLNDSPPLVTAARLVQEDLCLLTRDDTGWRLTGGAMCFPAHWTLAQKIGRPLLGVHDPVAHYTDELSTRIDRILDHLRPDAPLMRANTLIYTDPSLHQPMPEGAAKILAPGVPRYVRVERQTLRRLPQTRAIVFAIHTQIVSAAALPAADHDALLALKPELAP